MSGIDSKKFKTDMAVAGDFAGGSHNALTTNVKMEKSEKIQLTAGSSLLTGCASPPSTFTPLTLALPLFDALRPGAPGRQPMDASDDLLDAFDLDIAPAGTPIKHIGLFGPSLSKPSTLLHMSSSSTSSR